MYLKRLQIDDGFLEGVDVQLSQGLNTIIGARGTGKTSLLELIRFCLGAEGFSSGNQKKSFAHALSVIGDGKVTATLVDGDREILVSRGASDPAPYSTSPFAPPIVLSQTEVESVGLLAQGRLELIDSFLTNNTELEKRDAYTSGEIKSISRELDSLIKDRSEALDSLLELNQVNLELDSLAEREHFISNYSATASDKQAKITEQALELSKYAIQDSYIERYSDRIREGLSTIQKGIEFIASAENWVGERTHDPLINLRGAISINLEHLFAGHSRLQNLIPLMNSIRAEISSNRASTEETNRVLRKEFESIVEGAGAISRESSRLRERKAKLENLAMFAVDQESRISVLAEKRSELLNQLEECRSSKFSWRKQACETINDSLGPKIRIKIDRSSQIDQYISLLSEALRGSGLKYNEVAKTVGTLISPRELGDLVQASDYDQLSKITGITRDRAAKLLNHLLDAGMGELLTCAIEDVISFQLLDGSTYKDLANLSTGQRCTVVLPIVLEHTNHIIIVDQPEDHIDNAFIAETLIKSIRKRSKSSQIIFTTHNANIPVLGVADRVIHMASDGRRGYVQLEKQLNHHDSIEAISNVMEGGKDAFEHRAKFYAGTSE
jgi:energy-coupling factor transporter ATP-binding protein EcfA2